MTSPNALGELCGFSAKLAFSQLPAAVIHKAEALLLYGVAVGVTSAGSSLAQKVGAAMRMESAGSGEPALCLLDGMPMSMGNAAFCNAALFHVRIQDDAHPAGHLGTVILPAALALAEAKGSDGRSLLTSIVSGYEVALRIGRDHAADLSSAGLRTTPIYGVMGAAAASARLLGLDAAQTLNALAFTVHCAAGMREFADAGTDEYPFQAAFAARNGISCALLASQGLTGTDTALTGKAGLYKVFGKAGKDYGSRLLDRLGSQFETEQMTYKPYPGGQFHRGVIRGFIDLRTQAPGAGVESAEVLMHPFEANYLGLSYHGPFRTYTQSFFSVPFCAALAWLDGDVTFAALNEFDRPEVLDLVKRTQVIADPQRERYKPLIRVRLKSGATLEWLDNSGEASYNLTWDIAVDMTHRLSREVGIDAALAEALVHAVGSLDAQLDVRAVMRAADAMARAAGPRANDR